MVLHEIHTISLTNTVTLQPEQHCIQ